MKFIETKDGFSVNVDQIEAIEKVDDFTSRIFTASNSYEAHFPYSALLRILEGLEVKPKEETVLKKLEGVLDHAQHVAL